MRKLILSVFLVPILTACGGFEDPDLEATENEVRAARVPIECPKSCDIVPGDANSDGVTDIFDASIITQWLFGGGRQPCERAADANGDGQVDLSDVSLIGQYAHGEDVIFSAPKCEGCPSDCSRIEMGDVNSDGRVDISDFISLHGWLSQGNPSTVCAVASDINGDGAVDYSDLTAFSQYMWQAKKTLAAPICP